MIFVWSNGFTETTMGTSVLKRRRSGLLYRNRYDNNDCTQVASFELENADIPYIVVNYFAAQHLRVGQWRMPLSGI